jgi:signal transduction histidine kinase
MDEVELLRVFERYYQSSQNNRGEGIGLAIVKEYCDKSNISIDIQSKPNKGTTVILDLGTLKK